MKKFVLFTIMVVCTLFAKGADDKNKSTLTSSFYYLRGIEARMEGNNEEAISCLLKEMEKHSNNGYACYELAEIMNDRHENGAALSWVNKAIKYIPKKEVERAANAYLLRATLYELMCDTLKAHQDLDTYIKLMPKDVRGYLVKGHMYMEQHEWEQAEEYFRKSIAVDESNCVTYYMMGELYNQQERWKEALEFLDKSLILCSNEESGYVQRSIAYMAIEEWDKAADDILEALKLPKNDKAYSLMVGLINISPKAYQSMENKLLAQVLKTPNDFIMTYYLAILYCKAEQYDKAVIYLKKSYEHDNDVETALILASCYTELGMLGTAQKYIHLAEEERPDDTNILRCKADIEYYDGKTEDAISTYTKCIELDPGIWYDYYRRGFYKDNAGMAKEAIEDYTSCIILNPAYAYAYLGRGDQYMKVGEKEKAMEDYRMVVKLDSVPSTEATAYYAFLALGEREKAIAFCDSCLARFPDNAGLLYDAACLYSRMGEYKRALEYLNEAFEKGFRKFNHIANDDDLNAIKEMSEYKELIEKYKITVHEEYDDIKLEGTEEVVEIPFTKNGGNTCNVKCTINGLPLHFIFDTGACDISLSQVEATFMIKNGYLSSNDITGSSYYMDATGNVSEGTNIILKNVNFGGLRLNNVKASVVKNQKAPLLLGQSVLGKLGKIEIDNIRNMLVITHKKQSGNVED